MVAPVGSGTGSKEDIYTPYLCLPYKGRIGEEVVQTFRNVLTKTLPKNVKPRITYQGKKIGSFFRIKDKIPLEHESNLVYAFKPKGSTNESTDYVGETKVRFGTRTDQHCYTDTESSVYKHKVEKNLQISPDDFEILDKGFSKDVDRKLCEALYIKDLDPILNRQKKSYNLLLFN